MGSKGSKQKVETEQPDGNSVALRQPVEYKTSVYGWGHLKHPVKKQNGPTTKKKKKTKHRDDPRAAQPMNNLQDNNLNSTNHQNANGVPILRLAVSPDVSNNKLDSAPVYKPPGAARSNPNLSSNSKLLNNSFEPVKPKRSSLAIPTPFKLADDLAEKRLSSGSAQSKSGAGKLNAEVGENPKNGIPRELNLKLSSSLTSTSTPKQFQGGQCFYGQYRCFKCKKYWRSSFAQEGISQNCSKCGTSTFPRR